MLVHYKPSLKVNIRINLNTKNYKQNVKKSFIAYFMTSTDIFKRKKKAQGNLNINIHTFNLLKAIYNQLTIF